MREALITIAENRRQKEYWTKPVPISVIFSDSKKRAKPPVWLIQILKTNSNLYLRKADCQNNLFRLFFLG